MVDQTNNRCRDRTSASKCPKATEYEQTGSCKYAEGGCCLVCADDHVDGDDDVEDDDDDDDDDGDDEQAVVNIHKEEVCSLLAALQSSELFAVYGFGGTGTDSTHPTRTEVK